MRTIRSAITSALWLAAAGVSCSRPARDPAPAADTAQLTRVTVSRPTVVSFFIVPDGAVDTMPDLAVTADDWNYAMATLGDSLEAAGFAFALITGPRVRISGGHPRDTTVALGEPYSAGYVFVRPGEAPCMRRRPMDPDSVLAVARVLAAGREIPADSCER